MMCVLLTHTQGRPFHCLFLYLADFEHVAFSSKSTHLPTQRPGHPKPRAPHLTSPENKAGMGRGMPCEAAGGSWRSNHFLNFQPILLFLAPNRPYFQHTTSTLWGFCHVICCFPGPDGSGFHASGLLSHFLSPTFFPAQHSSSRMCCLLSFLLWPREAKAS